MHLRFLVVVLFVAGVAGCGAGSGPAYNPNTLLKGKVTKGGQPLQVNKAQMGNYARVEVAFVPVAGGTAYSSEVKDDGTFEIVTTEGKAIPTGKYKIAVRQLEYQNDLLQGKFDEQNTPITRDITTDTKEVTIDLDNPNG
jgi:hypothetical protein